MTRTIDDGEIAAALTHPDLVEELARAHRAHHAGDLVQPVPTVLALPGTDLPGTDLPGADPTGAGLAGSDQAALDRPHHVLMSVAAPDLTLVKTLLDAPTRRSLGEPAQRSVISVYATRTGDCLALLDGRTLTRMRTAAATALAVRTLARPDAEVVGVLGAGALAAEHVRAIAATTTPRTVLLWARRPEAAEQLRATLAAEEGLDGLDLRTVAAPAEVAALADAVVTVTPSREPLLHAGDLRPGLHVSAVGSPPRPGYRELADDALHRADAVVVDDSRIAAHESTQVRSALEHGLAPSRLVELGAVLAGAAVGRSREDSVTVHSSIGVALQDLAAVRLVLRAVGVAVPDPAGRPDGPARLLG